MNFLSKKRGKAGGGGEAGSADGERGGFLQSKVGDGGSVSRGMHVGSYSGTTLKMGRLYARWVGFLVFQRNTDLSSLDWTIIKAPAKTPTTSLYS